MSRESLLALAAGMREAADWIEANADLPIRSAINPRIDFWCNTAEEIAQVARCLGKLQKKYNSEIFYVRRQFSKEFGIDVNIWREQVCRKIEKQVVIPASAEVVIPAKPESLETVVEWECPESLLAPELPAQAATT